MKEILLIHPLYGQQTTRRIFQPGIELPISLAYLAAYLEREGISCDILDLRLEREPDRALREKIEETSPPAVGITASTAGIEEAARLARQIKALNGNIKVIVGGWHASALPEDTLRRHPHFDYVVHGEGEQVLNNLLNCIVSGRAPYDTKGTALRSNGDIIVNPRESLIEDLNTLPFPARHKVRITRYHPNPGTRNCLRFPSTGILIGRGCPYGCLFCYKGVWGPGVRFRSPENVLEELEVCIDRYNIRDFRFYDDSLTFPKWDLDGFCNEIIKRKLNISWNCWSRVNDVDEDKLRLMKAAGCYHIKYGIEFGTTKALRLSKKGATLEQAGRAVSLARKVGLECKGSFVFGIPGETVEDCEETIDFSIKISPDFATFYAFDPIPGSVFHKRIISGEIDVSRDLLPHDVAQDLANRAFRKFYLRKEFVLQRMRALLDRPKVELTMIANGAAMVLAYCLRSLAAPFAESCPALRKKVGEAARKLDARLTRAMDLSVSLTLFILTLPLMGLIAFAIKLDSPGPAIFKQTRIGQDRRKSQGKAANEAWVERRKRDLGGRPFTFYKFRTMYVDARERFPQLYDYRYTDGELAELYFKVPDDPRLTRLGKRLRKTTLDELPNLLNIVKGDMTLVGPRPDIPEMIKYYDEEQMKKLQVKPGVTGLAQVSGRGLLSFKETLRCDVEWVEKRSLLLTWKILLKTIYVTIFRVGAF